MRAILDNGTKCTIPHVHDSSCEKLPQVHTVRYIEVSPEGDDENGNPAGYHLHVCFADIKGMFAYKVTLEQAIKLTEELYKTGRIDLRGTECFEF